MSKDKPHKPKGSFFQDETKDPRPVIELVPEIQEGHGDECDNVDSDSDCACE